MERKTNTGTAYMLRFISRHIVRHRFKTLLLMLLAIIFTLSAASLNMAAVNSVEELERCYRTTLVEIDLVPAVNANPNPDDTRPRGVTQSIIDEISNTGYAQSIYTAGVIKASNVLLDGTMGMGAYPFMAINDVEAFSERNTDVLITYFDNFSNELFNSNNASMDAPVPVIIPDALYQTLADIDQAKKENANDENNESAEQGTENTEDTESVENTENVTNTESVENTENVTNTESVENTENVENTESVENAENTENPENDADVDIETGNEEPLVFVPLDTKLSVKLYASDKRTYDCDVVGVYRGMINDLPIIAPSSYIVGMLTEGRHALTELKYTFVHITISPEKNRELEPFRNTLNSLLSQSVDDVQAVFWDSELRTAIEPMENTIDFLRILYPVVIAISALIAAGVCVLFTILSSKDAAIMHVQGTTKSRVRTALTLQLLFTCIIGVVLGLLGIYIFMYVKGQTSINTIFIDTLEATGIYLLATLLGAWITSIFVTRKHPIELLQVKE